MSEPSNLDYAMAREACHNFARDDAFIWTEVAKQIAIAREQGRLEQRSIADVHKREYTVGSRDERLFWINDPDGSTVITAIAHKEEAEVWATELQRAFDMGQQEPRPITDAMVEAAQENLRTNASPFSRAGIRAALEAAIKAW